MTPRHPSSSRLHIDWTRCDGRGLCTELLPKVLRRDPWGYPLAYDGSRDPVIPANLLGDAHAAVRRCPRLAVSVIESTKPDEQQGKTRGRGGS